MIPLNGGIDISIARCRDLLGDQADSMTDDGVAEIRRHALAMAHIVVEMYEERSKNSE